MSNYDPYFPVFSPDHTGTSKTAGLTRISEDPNKWSLYDAVTRDRLDVVQRILSSPAKFDFQVIAGSLRLAAQRGYIEVARCILSRTKCQVDVHCPDGYTPLVLAARHGHDETVQMLIDHGADPSRAIYRTRVSALHWAAVNGHMPVVDVLLKAGANANALTLQRRTPLMLAACYGHTDIVKRLCRAADNVSHFDANTMSALHMTVMEGYGRCVDLLLSEGADVDTQNLKGYTPLLMAIERDHAEIAFRLIRSGANLELALNDCLCRAIHMAIALERREICSYLIDGGCSLTAHCQLVQSCCGSIMINGAVSPLHIAATGRDLETLSTMLDKLEQQEQLTKGFMFASTVHGFSPLMLAAAFGSTSVQNELLRRCKKFSIKDDLDWLLSEISLAILCACLRGRVASLVNLLQMTGSRLPKPRLASGVGNNRLPVSPLMSSMTPDILNELCPEGRLSEGVIGVLMAAGNCDELLRALVEVLPDDTAMVEAVSNYFSYPNRLEVLCVAAIRRAIGPLFLAEKVSTLSLPPSLLTRITL